MKDENGIVAFDLEGAIIVPSAFREHQSFNPVRLPEADHFTRIGGTGNPKSKAFVNSVRRQPAARA